MWISSLRYGQKTVSGMENFRLKIVDLSSTFRKRKAERRFIVLRRQKCFCACLYRLPFTVFRPYHEEESTFKQLKYFFVVLYHIFKMCLNLKFSISLHTCFVVNFFWRSSMEECIGCVYSIAFRMPIQQKLSPPVLLFSVLLLCHKNDILSNFRCRNKAFLT